MAERRREFYAKQLAQLEEALAAVEVDLEIVPTERKRLQLRKEAEKLLSEIEEVTAKLAQCDALASEPRVRDRSFEKTLQKIDFTQAKDMAAQVRQKLNPWCCVSFCA